MTTEPTTVPDFGAEWDGKAAKALTGGFEGPQWTPHYAQAHSKLIDSEITEKLAKLGAGSTTRDSLRGMVQVVRAWGRAVYALDVKTSTGLVRVLLPEHGIVYSALNLCEPGKTLVGLRYNGKRKMKNGKSAHDYTIGVLDGPAHNEPRKDALTIESMDARELRKARAEAARARAEAGDVGDDDDLPI